MAFEELDGKQLDRLARLFQHAEMWRHGCTYAVDSFYLPSELMKDALDHLAECRDCQALLKQRETGDSEEVLLDPTTDCQAERFFQEARQEAAVAQMAGADHIFNRLRRSEQMVTRLESALATARAFHTHLKALSISTNRADS